jgi:3-hydroxyacyl-[acyl-carrier-protein] dehydratase
MLFDLSEIDMNRVIYSVEQIEAVNPHRGAIRMLDGFIWASEDFTRGLAFKDARPDEFWVPVHIPGKPLMPGVLMLEAAAQMASFLCKKHLGLDQGSFLAFTGLDKVRFRGQVVPGDRLILLAREDSFKPRRMKCAVQGYVNDRLAFEAEVQGMPIPVETAEQTP